jgi:hypothetical protein
MYTPVVDSLALSPELIPNLWEKGFADINLADYRDAVKNTVEKNSAHFSAQLDKVFSAPAQVFKQTHINCELEQHPPQPKPWIAFNSHYDLSAQALGNDRIRLVLKTLIDIHEETLIEYSAALTEAIQRFIYDSYTVPTRRRPFAITAERSGIQLFQKQLDDTASQLVEKFKYSLEHETSPALFASEHIARYPLTVQRNIDQVRHLSELRKHLSMFTSPEGQSKPSSEHILHLLGLLSGGTFQAVEGDTYFMPHSVSKRKKANAPIPIYLASSAAKSLVLLDVFLRHLASPKHLLIIDEPELNLHPKNQLIMARLLATLANAGVYVLITTHSDFIVREINHLMMLSQEFADKETLMQRFGYDPAEILSPDKVNLYVAQDNTLKPAPKDNFGFQLDSFDDVILNPGDVTNALTFALEI